MKFFRFYFLGFFFALLSSQSLMDLFSGLLFFSGLVLILRKNISLPEPLVHIGKISFPWPRLPIEKIFVIWPIIVLTGLLLNAQADTTILKSTLEYRWIIEMYLYSLVFIYIKPSPKDFYYLSCIALFAGLFAVVVYFLGFDPFFENWSDRQKYITHMKVGDEIKALSLFRTGGLMSNPMPFAQSYAPLAFIILGLCFGAWKSHSKHRMIFLFASLFMILGVYLSFTRGVIIGVVLSAGVFLYLIRPKWAALGLVSGIITFALLFQFHLSFRERVLFSLKPSGQTYDSERIMVWKANALISKEYPFLGIGYGENSRRLPEFYARLNYNPEFPLISHAHNQYLHFLAGTGILGLSCYLLVVFYFLNLAYRNFRFYSWNTQPWDKGLALGCICAQICFQISGLTESNFSIAKNRYVMMFIWALLIYQKSLLTRSPSPIESPVK